eukprot:797210-Rhodomonas_salina.2
MQKTKSQDLSDVDFDQEGGILVGIPVLEGRAARARARSLAQTRDVLHALLRVVAPRHRKRVSLLQPRQHRLLVPPYLASVLEYPLLASTGVSAVCQYWNVRKGTGRFLAEDTAAVHIVCIAPGQGEGKA